MILYQDQIMSLYKIAVLHGRPIKVEHQDHLPGSLHVVPVNTVMDRPPLLSTGVDGHLEAAKILCNKIEILPHYLIYPDGTYEESD